MKTLYTAHVTATQGREGRVESDDNILSLKLTKPGAGKDGTNPEQLFAAGYGACFGSAVEAIAKKQQIQPSEIIVKADVELNQDNEDGYFIAATLHVSIKGVDAAVAKQLVQSAHQICPYSKATRGNIKVNFTVNDEELSMMAA